MPGGRGTGPGTTRRRETEPAASLKRERWQALRETVADNMELLTPGRPDVANAPALEELGGSASIGELDDRVATDMDLGEAVLGVVHGDGPQSEFAYRCAWARTRLRRIDAVDNSARGGVGDHRGGTAEWVGQRDHGTSLTPAEGISERTTGPWGAGARAMAGSTGRV